MRPSHILPLVALAAAAVLAFVASDLRYERARLLDDFGQAQHALAQQVGSDLQKELHDIDEDARLISNLVQRPSVHEAVHDSATGALLHSAFQALASVVRHYRLVGLVGPAGPIVVAPDPSERSEAVADFMKWSAAVAARAREARAAVLDGPRETNGGRQFYLYALPAKNDEVIVLVWEARLFFQMVLRPRPPHIGYFVLDPALTMWVGCGDPSACRGLTHPQWSAVAGLRFFSERLGTRDGTSWGADAMAASLGLPDRSAVVAWTRLEAPDRRPWTMGVLVSATTLESRERSLLRRLFMVSGALVVALSAVAAVVIRHLRRTAVLGERLRTAQQVAHLRERSEKLLENVPVGLIGITGDGTVALVNRFLEERVGEVTVGRPLSQAFPAAGAEAAATLDRVLRASLQEGQLRPRRGDQLLLPGPKPGHFELRIVPLDQAAEDISALVLMEDFSEIRNLEQQLIRAEKLVTTGVITAGLAHEIGTPLTIIRARAESLLERVSDPTVRKDLESVVVQIDHIAATIRQVLDFSRAQPVELRPTDARAAVAGALGLLDWRFRQKSLRVKVESDERLDLVAADPDQLQQVLVNLLMNAVDASEKGQTVTVRLANAPGPPRGVKVEVVDGGCGIPAAHINAVFDPFFTTKKRGEGTGLGLSVVASIIRNHQGEITLSSEAGKGTTVVVFLPSTGPKERRQ